MQDQSIFSHLCLVSSMIYSLASLCLSNSSENVLNREHLIIGIAYRFMKVANHFQDLHFNVPCIAISSQWNYNRIQFCVVAQAILQECWPQKLCKHGIHLPHTVKENAFNVNASEMARGKKEYHRIVVSKSHLTKLGIAIFPVQYLLDSHRTYFYSILFFCSFVHFLYKNIHINIEMGFAFPGKSGSNKRWHTQTAV